MSEIKYIQQNVQKCIMFSNFAKNFTQLPGCPLFHHNSTTICVDSIIRYSHHANQSPIKIWVLKQSGWKVWLSVQYLKIYDQGSLNFSKHDLYGWSRLRYQMTRYYTLTHLPLDTMAATSQTKFSDAFSWMKILYFDENFVFWLQFHCSLFLII